MTRKRTNPDFMNGVPELLILQLLSRQEMYGYKLVSAIEKSTLSAISFGEGVIYPVLHGLERDRCLASRRAVANGRTRVYYRITAKGKRRLQDTVSDWTRMALAVGRIVGKPSYAATA